MLTLHLLQQAVHADNRRLARFLYDMLLFNYFPYHTPTGLVGALFWGYFLAIQYTGFLLGSIYWTIFYVIASWTLLQYQVIDHNSRINLGVFYGFFSFLLSLYMGILFPLLSSYTNLWYITTLLGFAYANVQFVCSKPLVALQEHKKEMMRKIIRSSPNEGTDEENAEQNMHLEGSTITTTATGDEMKIYKDPYTGKIQVVRVRKSEEDDEEGDGSSKRIRSLGPRICGHCLCDKRIISLAPTSSGNGLNGNGNGNGKYEW